MTAAAPTVRTCADLRPGEHLCFLYRTEEEHQAFLRAFFHDGIQRNEKIIYIADQHPVDDILGFVHGEGLNVDLLLQRRHIMVCTIAEMMQQVGAANLEELLAAVVSEAACAYTEEYTGIRLTGEMTWMRQPLDGCHRFLEFEARSTQVFAEHRCLAVCQYDEQQFDPATLLNVLATHPTIMSPDAVFENLYHVPTEQYLAEDVSAATYRQWFTNMGIRDEVWRALHGDEPSQDATTRELTARLLQANMDRQQEIGERIRLQRAVNQKAGELEHFKALYLDRERRVRDLQQMVNQLSRELSRPEPYPATESS